jgi:hypothetical protein
LFKGFERNVLHLEADTKKLLKKLINLKYNMEDHKTIAVEAQGDFKLAKYKMQKLTNQMMFLKE